MTPALQAILDQVNQLGGLVNDYHTVAGTVTSDNAALLNAQATLATDVGLANDAKAAVDAKVSDINDAVKALAAS